MEGSVVHAGCPVFQITAEEPYAHLCTFMETILTHIWRGAARACPRLPPGILERSLVKSESECAKVRASLGA